MSLCRRHLSSLLKSGALALNPNAGIRVQNDVLCPFIRERLKDRIAQFPPQLSVEPSLLIETAIEGVMLESPVDMVRVWPTIWRNTRAADRSLAKGVPALPGFDRLRYQLDGAKMKPRIAYFDRELISDPRAWLEERLGLLRKLSR